MKKDCSPKLRLIIEWRTKAKAYYDVCYKGDRALPVMKNCMRIALHEIGDKLYFDLIKTCNDLQMTMSDYIAAEAEYLLATYYGPEVYIVY